MSIEEYAVETMALGREFTVFHKEEGVWASLKAFWAPKVETIFAVHSLDLRIARGEIVGFLGPNGAGKTTTLKMLSGLIAPTMGTVTVGGREPFRREREFLRTISLVMGQKQNLWWDLPPLETFAIHREMYDIPADEYSRRVDELVELLEIRDFISVQTRKLSLGQRMRCELAASLLHRPEILFLDEPTIGLDIIMQKRIRQFLLDYHERFRPTIILTSHYMEDVAALARRVVVINRGVKVFDGSLATLTAQARPEKTLTVTFQSLPPDLDLEAMGEIITSESLRFVLRVPREDAPRVAANLYSTGKVLDLAIEESPLEEVITHLFSRDAVER
jgi:ABC-2 type transport system ATP-binding protein